MSNNPAAPAAMELERLGRGTPRLSRRGTDYENRSWGGGGFHATDL